LAASRTFCTAGTSSAIRIAIIAITTSNSISVEPAAALQNERFMVTALPTWVDDGNE